MIRSISAAVLIALSCLCAGGLVSRRQVLPRAVHFALGLAILGTAAFCLTIAGFANTVAFALLCASPIVVAAPVSPGEFRVKMARPGLLTASALAFTLYLLVFSLAPESLYDSSGYHLGLPSEWLRLGKIPHRVAFYEMLPQGVESVYAVALAIGNNSVAAKLIHFACLLACVALVGSIGRLLQLPSWAAPAAALVLVTSPVVAISGTSAYTDLALLLSILAAFHLSVYAWRSGAIAPWALAGVASGFAYSIKMPGLALTAAICGGLLAVRKFKAAAAFTASASICILPWMIRSYSWTGNPVAPLFNALFPNPHFGADLDLGLSEFSIRHSPLPWYRIPVDLALSGSALQGLLGPFALIAILGVAGIARKNTRWLSLWAIGLCGLYLSNIGARFAIPAFVFLSLALLAMLPRGIATTLAGCSAILCMPPLAARYASPTSVLPPAPFAAAFGRETQPDYLRRVMPVYRFAEAIKEIAPPGSIVFDCAGVPAFHAGVVTLQYWQNRQMGQIYDALLKGSRDEASSLFRSSGVSYVAIASVDAKGIPWAEDFMREPDAWGFTLAAVVDTYRLYKLKR